MIKYRFSCSADVCPCILTNYGTFISLSAAVSRLPVTETTLLSLFLYHTFQSSENTTLVITPTSDHRMIRLWSRSPKQITAAFICESPGLSPGPLLVVFDSVISWSSALYCSPCCCCLGLIVCKKLHPHRHQGGGCRPAGAGGCPYKLGFRVRNIIPNQSALCTPNFTSFSLYLLKKNFHLDLKTIPHTSLLKFKSLNNCIK